jgi:hypothetical protein
MEAPAMPMTEEVAELTRWDEDELDLLAFELWQRASCPEAEAEQDPVEAEAFCHASCL